MGMMGRNTYQPVGIVKRGRPTLLRARQAFCQITSRKRLLLSSFSKHFFGGFIQYQGVKRSGFAFFTIIGFCKYFRPATSPAFPTGISTPLPRQSVTIRTNQKLRTNTNAVIGKAIFLSDGVFPD
jgi:hypothetical protein